MEEKKKKIITDENKLTPVNNIIISIFSVKKSEQNSLIGITEEIK